MSLALLRGIPFALIIIAIAGFSLGVYLTAAHYGDTPLVCGGVGDCGYVQSSDYASVVGIPVSALGAVLYLALGLAAAAWAKFSDAESLPVVCWGIALAGAGYAAYLTYVELFVLEPSASGASSRPSSSPPPYCSQLPPSSTSPVRHISARRGRSGCGLAVQQACAVSPTPWHGEGRG